MKNAISQLKTFAANRAESLAAGAVVLVGSMSANAAADTSAVTTAMTDIAAVGAAALGAYIAARAFKWIKSAL